MTNSAIRHTLRRARQDKRLASLSPEVRTQYPDACKIYVIFGGDLEKLKRQRPTPMKRALRSLKASQLRNALRKQLKEEKQQPVSFKQLKKMAQEYTRRAIKRVQKKSVM